MKPLSQKTLAKKYAALGLPEAKIALLHDYFSSFANLYGAISVGEAWDVFRHYEGIGQIRKKNFIEFSSIVQREAGHPYSVLELKEVYSGETSENPLYRIIANNDLIISGYNKYILLYNTEEQQSNHPYYLPEKKEDLLLHKQDQFYLTDEGERMVSFLRGLKTDGKFKDFKGEIAGEILDIEGKPVAGKRLSEFVFYTDSEQFDIDYYKSESKKSFLRKEYKKTALEKVLQRIRINLLTGGFYPTNQFDDVGHLSEWLDREIGVLMSKNQTRRFIELYMNLNNNSHLWLNSGWKPVDLSRRYRGGGAPSLSLGPNIQKMFESAELDKEDFEKKLKEMGITLL